MATSGTPRCLLCTFCGQVVVWVRYFIEPDLFDNNVPFVNTTPVYLINLLWKLELRLGLDSSSCTILAFFTENNENEHQLIFCEFRRR